MSETKVTVIYDNPVDAGAFESAYESEQLEAARRIPGYLRFEASKVWPKEDGTPTPAYRMLDLYYPGTRAGFRHRGDEGLTLLSQARHRC